ncbi:MAG: hypothetical protein ACE5Q6_19750, partial [Dehalococcoidia bacterium]
RSFLQQATNDFWANANDANRKVVFSPLSTLSSGYDSPAATVFAKSVGCKDVLILRRYSLKSHPLDYGGPIAKQLGLQTIEHDRWKYLEMKGCPEAEFLATLPSGFESNWVSFEPDVPQKLLFTGYGGTLLDRNADYGPDFARSDLSGLSISEFRMKTGFILLHLHFVGVPSYHSIRRISTSPEMDPWSVSDSYDRPIARRIVEEAGVDRHLFGQQKHGSVVRFSLPGVAKEEEVYEPRSRGTLWGPLTAQTREEFSEYCEKQTGGKEYVSRSTNRQRGLMACWSVEKIRHRYAEALLRD